MNSLTGSGFGIDILEDTRVVPTDNGDHDRFSHYVRKDDMMKGMVYGVPVRALCGKIWVPEQDGMKFPVCPMCKDIYNSLPGGDSDGEDE